MIKILNATSKPITHMGKVAGVCYNSNTERDDLNYKRGMKCIKDNHGRIMEFADATMALDEYSARVMRELYTHIIGTSRVQASTRYIEYDNFNYYTPECLEYNEEYHDAMRSILESYNDLVNSGISKEHAANLLPLGMTSKVVLKINYRALLHLAEVRLCSRAYIEIQDMLKEMIEVISGIDDEWKELMAYMKPRCKTCTEKESCKLGRK